MGPAVTRLSNAVQIWLLRHPNPVTNALLSVVYAVEVAAQASGGIQTFLIDRKNVLGPNFAALGRIVLGTYDDAAELIRSAQKRAAFLGPLRLVKARFSDYFILFASDEEAGGGELHDQVRDTIWELILGPASQRSEDPVALGFIDDLVRTLRTGGDPPEPDVLTPEVQRMVVRYTMRVVMEVDLGDAELESLRRLAFSAKPAESLIVSRTSPLGLFPVPRKVREATELFENLVDDSPPMVRFEAANRHGLDRRTFVRSLVEMMVIAAFGGSSNLAVALLTRVSPDLVIDLEDQEQVERLVLETARRWPPVNHVNAVAQEPVSVTIAGKSYDFPAGTVLDVGIGIANLDAQAFPEPLDVKPEREDLGPDRLLSFNGVGDEGRRRCPGRDVAVAMGRHLLVRWRRRRSPSAATELVNL